jgi:hypothetical protein
MQRSLGEHSGPVIAVSINRINGHVFTLTRTELRLYSLNGDLITNQIFRDADHARHVAGASALYAVGCPDWQAGVVAVTGHVDGAVLLWTMGRDGQLRICRALPDRHGAAITIIRSQQSSTDAATAAKGVVDKLFSNSSTQDLLVGDAAGCCSRWTPAKLDQMHVANAEHLLPSPPT